MLQIARTENNKSSLLIHKVNYTQLYNQLKVLLPADLINLFAKPDIGLNYTIWLTEFFSSEAQLQTFSSLAENEKNLAAAEIEDKREKIRSILSGHPILGPLIEQLFQIAEEGDIYILNERGERTVILCRWASKSNTTRTGTNPLTAVIERSGNKRSEVELDVRFNDGDFASNMELIVEYKGATKKYMTDEYGKVSLGLFLEASLISICFEVGNVRRYYHEFSVDGSLMYNIRIPKLGIAIISVLNQDNVPIPNCRTELTYKGNLETYTSNENGTILLENLELGERIGLSASINYEAKLISSKIELELKYPENNIKLILKEPRPVNLSIRTINQHGKAVSVNLGIESESATRAFMTDDRGRLQLNAEYELGEKLNISVDDYGYSLQHYQLNSKDNELEIRLEIPDPKLITVKILGFSKELLPDLKIDFSVKKLVETKTTDAESKCQFYYGAFEHNEKIKASINYPIKKKNGDTKTVLYSKSFRYDENQNEYILQLKKRNWWWLLLLLIPLLLIQCEKEVPVKVINMDKNVQIGKIEVSMNYCRQNLFRPYRLFAFDKTTLKDISDQNGNVTIKKVRYSIFSWIFFNFTKATFSADYTCNNNTVSHYLYYLPDTVKIGLSSKEFNLDFIVVDKITQKPLTDATVSVEYEDEFNKTVSEQFKTDKSGKILTKLNNCAKNLRIRGSKPSYEDDELNREQVADFEGELLKNRKLELDKTPIEIPCNEAVVPGNDGIHDREFHVGNRRNLTIDYNFQTVKDRFVVYCGTKDNLGKIIEDTGYINLTGRLYIDLSACDTEWITIRVYGGLQTSWEYRFLCP